MAAAVHERNPTLLPVSRPLDEWSVHSATKSYQSLDENFFSAPSATDDLSIWRKVDSELEGYRSEHHRYWWKRGKGLAIILRNAGYPVDLQYRDLKFYAQLIAPFLGVSKVLSGANKIQWPSFMTDDGSPVELSWDWGTGDKSPTIRYSVEPIGLHAGTDVDPRNLEAAPMLHKQLAESLPEFRQEWHKHFLRFFNSFDGSEPARDAADHNSTIFYAFDLLPNEVTAKTYFFPKFRAMRQNRSKLDVLSEAITTAPDSTKENLQAWSAFHNFASDPRNHTLEHEMLAIDLIDPIKSRMKVYFRCRETSFDSVINVMTLGGRVDDPMLYRGLIDLSRLWNALFDVEDLPLDEPLRECGHRTAGILYNIEFRHGDRFPAAKVYMPVRHYSRNDTTVIRALDQYFQSRRRGKYMADYVKTMSMLFSAESMRSKPGVQTYVGASVRPDGKLRVVSYFKSDMAESLLEM